MILKDRVAIVTGAGSGIGRAGAAIMAREGAVVMVFDRDREAAGETVRLIRDAGGRAEACAVDVTDDEALTREIAATMERHGRIDILHNHAAAPIPELLARLVERVGPALDAAGDRELVTDGLSRVAEHGNGASRQRRAWARRHDVDDVLAEAAAATLETS